MWNTVEQSNIRTALSMTHFTWCESYFFDEVNTKWNQKSPYTYARTRWSILFWLISMPCRIWSYLILSYLILSYLILSYPASLIPMINLTTVLSYFHFIWFQHQWKWKSITSSNTSSYLEVEVEVECRVRAIKWWMWSRREVDGVVSLFSRVSTGLYTTPWSSLSSS